ncbi:MAG: hypothetical protein OSA93_12390 [Akkermansiaceae bacterium]|jgi:hypothetical protein|nr:hypothetical protein [Akkermansiaceae bacterium]
MGIIKALLLDGAIAKTAHFNLKPRRNAASVHLAYPTERGNEITAFDGEMTGVEDPLWTTTWPAAGTGATSACKSTAPPNDVSFSASGI